MGSYDFRASNYVSFFFLYRIFKEKVYRNRKKKSKEKNQNSFTIYLIPLDTAILQCTLTGSLLGPAGRLTHMAELGGGPCDCVARAPME